MILLSQKNPLPMYPIFSKRSHIVGEVKLGLENKADSFSSIKKVAVDDHKFVITYVDRSGGIVIIRHQIPMPKGVSVR